MPTLPTRLSGGQAGSAVPSSRRRPAPRRRFAAVAIALGVAALALPATGSAATCPKPSKVKVTQKSVGVVKVSWKRGHGQFKFTKYRVKRGTAVVGQTNKTSMLVRAPAGSRITVRVGVVRAHGFAPRCWVRRAVTVKAYKPATADSLGAPKNLAVQVLTPRKVRLSWEDVPQARAYRIARDGKTVGQTSKTRIDLDVAPEQTHTFTVTAVAGNVVSNRSAQVSFDATRQAAGAPGALQAQLVTSESARLVWNASTEGSYPIAGYRITRDGTTVTQVNATTYDVSNLYPNRTYQLGVAAVDSRGVLGPPSTVTIRTTLPKPATGHLQAYVLASTDASFHTLVDHYDRVGVLYPTYYDCDYRNPSQIVGKDDPLITQWAHDRAIKVLPRINCQNTQLMHTITTTPSIKQAVIANMVALAQNDNYDGINLDYENGAAVDRDAFSSFVHDLAAALHAAGKQLSVCVSPKTADVPNHPRSTFFDYLSLENDADWIFVMSWGWHWQTSYPGPISPADTLTQVYNYVATMPLKQKFVMGLPLYGFDWPNGGGPYNPATPRSYGEIMSIAAQTGAQIQYDAVSQEYHFNYTDSSGVPHEVWFGDGPSVVGRLQIGASRGIGLGVWRLGQEDPAFWNQPLIAG